MQKLITTFTIPLALVHIVISYYWVFDWQKLETPAGIISWGGSILLGIAFYLLHRKYDSLIVYKVIVAATTSMTFLLALGAILITMITSSMP